MNDSSRAVIKARGLGLRFETDDGTVDALADVDLTVETGEFVSLIGPSGCGKTTFLRCIADLEQATSGTLEVAGKTPEQARLARSYGYVFQSPALYPWRTVEENVRLPHEVFGTEPAARERAIANNLELVGLTDFAKKYPWQLSGGMRQRVSIARALSFGPRLLLMDEPFGALDEITRDRLNLELLSIWRDSGRTVVFVTHSIPEAVFLSTRVVVMSPRPGRVSRVIDIGLPAERDMSLRDTPAFASFSAQVRAQLAQARPVPVLGR